MVDVFVCVLSIIVIIASRRLPPHVPSPPPTPPDAPKEIQALYRRFRRLDRSGRGTLSADDILMIPEVVMNPLAPRLLAQFIRDGESRINFRSFVHGLSVFNDKATPDRKTSAVFRIFDVDGDGYITESDVRFVLSLLCGTALSSAAADEIVRATISSADRDGDGQISEEDFSNVRDAFPWDSFTVPVRRAARDQYFLDNGHSLGPTLEGSEAPHTLELPKEGGVVGGGNGTSPKPTN